MTHGYTVYEKQTARQLIQWEKKLLQPAGLFSQTSKALQTRVNALIPERAHATITSAVKGIVETALYGLEYVPKQSPLAHGSLAERDLRAERLLSLYKKIAAAEGAGTGAGGLWLGLADFPILIGIKLKFLFELSHLYGHDTRQERERLFILRVFQLAFSSPDNRPYLLQTIRSWEPSAEHRQSRAVVPDEPIDWRKWQQEYRDTIDLRKLLQLLPGIGAVVGAWANYGLLEELGQTGMNAYRMRWLRRRAESGM